MKFGFSNPDPIVFEDTEKIENDFLSPSKLQIISGEENLGVLRFLRIVINTKHTTIGNFGKYLPSLNHLDLDDSFIPLIRDIGTSFHHLTVLHMSNCQLQDLDGIAIMQNLKELYLSSNHLEDISPVSFLDSLEILDLQKNRITDPDQLDYLALVLQLKILFFWDNPVCKVLEDGNKLKFEKYLFSKLSSLRKLNGNTAKFIDFSEDEMDDQNVTANIRSTTEPKFESIDNVPVTVKDTFPTPSPPLKNRPVSASMSRPGNDGAPLNRGSSGVVQSVFTDDHSSFLTFGNRLCGNPMQALKDRKKSTLHPLIALLSKKEEIYPQNSHPPRPSTAFSYRRKFKVISDDHLKVLKTNARNSVNFSKSEVQDSQEISSKTYFKTPSPPKMKASYSFPAPPKSSQRPKTSHGFRSRQYRRSLPQRQTQSVDVITLGNTEANPGSKMIAASIDCE